MKKSTRRLLVGSAIAGGTAAAIGAYVGLLRPRHLKWGSTTEETGRSMPMDDAIKDPAYVTTRSITINAKPEEIWPRLAPMGEPPRGGFFGYVWVEHALGMKVESSDQILPDFQELAVGQKLDRDGNMVVRGFEQNRWLVLGPPEGAIEQGDATWCMLLQPLSDDSTRLISRCRAKIPRNVKGLIWRALLDPGQLVMERKWLLGVKERVESAKHPALSSVAAA